MAPFPTQPPQEPPLEQFGVQPIGLCPAMFPRYGDTDEDLSSERGAALRLRLQEMQAPRLSVLKDADHVIAAHRHVAMVLPPQALDRRAIATAMRVDPFRRVNLAEIAGADPLGGRKLALDQRGRRRLAEAGERARDLLFRRIVSRYDRRRRLDAGREARGLSGHYAAEVV